MQFSSFHRLHVGNFHPEAFLRLHKNYDGTIDVYWRFRTNSTHFVGNRLDTMGIRHRYHKKLSIDTSNGFISTLKERYRATMNSKQLTTEYRSGDSLPSKSLPVQHGEKKKRSRIGVYIAGLLLVISMGSLKIVLEEGIRGRILFFGTSNDEKKYVTSRYRLDTQPEDVPEYPEYNEAEALQHIFYSKAAFCTEDSISSWSCGEMCDKAPIVGTDTIRYIPEGDRFKVQGYVAQVPTETTIQSSKVTTNTTSSIDQIKDTKCMISFRGSLNGANWYADFLAMLRPWPLNELTGADWCKGCMAHYGFTEAYEELREDVHRAVQELKCTRLVLTGHSLGAAIATIASFDLRAAMGYQVDATWTFGKPRIGNEEFVNNFEAAAKKQGASPPMWRVVHYHDPIPRAPPHLPGIHPVAHGSLEIYYTKRDSSEYLVCPQNGSMENQSDSCMDGWPLWLPVNMDHVNYLNQSFAFKDFPDECKGEEEKKKRDKSYFRTKLID